MEGRFQEIRAQRFEDLRTGRSRFSGIWRSLIVIQSIHPRLTCVNMRFSTFLGRNLVALKLRLS
jgi:hypothetical protein